MSRALRKACERSAAGLREVCERVGYKWLAEVAVEQVIREWDESWKARHDVQKSVADLRVGETKFRLGREWRQACISWVTCGEQLFSCRNCLRRAMP